MADTFLKIIDTAMGQLVFTKFQDLMGFTDQVKDIGEYPEKQALRMIAESRGEDTMESASVWRESESMDWSRHNTRLARHGLPVGYTDASRRQVTTVQALPVQINYTLIFWSLDRDAINQVTNRFIWWVHEYPKMATILLPDINFSLDLCLRFTAPVTHPTVEAELDKGRYFAVTLPITVDGWSLKDELVGTIVKADLLIYQGERDVLTSPLLFRERKLDIRVKSVQDRAAGSDQVAVS